MKDFSKIALLLTNSFRNPNELKSTKNYARPFEELGKWVTARPILALPVESKDYPIFIGASKDGFICVLLQGNNVVVYVFPTAQIHERNHSTRDLELAIMVFAVKV